MFKVSHWINGLVLASASCHFRSQFDYLSINFLYFTFILFVGEYALNEKVEKKLFIFKVKKLETE